MKTIEEFLTEQLKPSGLKQEEYSEVLIRLLDYGVIGRNESQVEATLYDRYVQCEQLVEDYLRVLGMRVAHDRQFAFVRVYPPGSQVPGLMDDENTPFNGGFRQRPTQQEVAVILVLRVEYEKALREGQVDDKGQVFISIEALAIALNNLVKRNLPEGKQERKTLFARLRQLRLIQFNLEDELDSDESWLCIQPTIMSFVSQAVLDTLQEANEVNRAEAEGALNTLNATVNEALEEDSLFNAKNTATTENEE